MAEFRSQNVLTSRRLLAVLACLALAVHLFGLYWPGSPDDSGFSFPGADKIAHFLLFAAPVWLLGRLTGRVWLVAVIFAVHGVVSELVQYWFLPHRSGDPLDLLADLIGIAVATVLLLVQHRRDSRSSVTP